MMNVPIRRGRWSSEAVLFSDRRWGAERSFTAMWTEGSLGFVLRWLEPGIPDGFRDQYTYWIGPESIAVFAKAIGIDPADPLPGLAEKWSGEERAIQLRRRLRRMRYVGYDRAEEERERSDAAFAVRDLLDGSPRLPSAAARRAILREELEQALGDTRRDYLKNIHLAFIAAVSRVTQTPRRHVTQGLCESAYPGLDVDAECFPNDDERLIRLAGGHPRSVSFSDGRGYLDAYTIDGYDYWVTEGNYMSGVTHADTPTRVAVIKEYMESALSSLPDEFELSGMSKAATGEIHRWVKSVRDGGPSR